MARGWRLAAPLFHSLSSKTFLIKSVIPVESVLMSAITDNKAVGGVSADLVCERVFPKAVRNVMGKKGI